LVQEDFDPQVLINLDQKLTLKPTVTLSGESGIKVTQINFRQFLPVNKQQKGMAAAPSTNNCSFPFSAKSV
jgi:hypothetical protein